MPGEDTSLLGVVLSSDWDPNNSSIAIRRRYAEIVAQRLSLGRKAHQLAESFEPQTNVVTENHPDDKMVIWDTAEKSLPLYHVLCAIFSEELTELLKSYSDEAITFNDFNEILKTLAEIRTFQYFIREPYQNKEFQPKKFYSNTIVSLLRDVNDISRRCETDIYPSLCYEKIAQGVMANLLYPTISTATHTTNKWSSTIKKTDYVDADLNLKYIEIYVRLYDQDQYTLMSSFKLSEQLEPPLSITMTHGQKLKEGLELCFKAFKDCLKKELSLNELTNRIAVLNFLMQTLSPVSRGTPTITQLLITSLYKLHGYEPVSYSGDICFHALSSTLEQHIPWFNTCIKVTALPQCAPPPNPVAQQPSI